MDEAMPPSRPNLPVRLLIALVALSSVSPEAVTAQAVTVQTATGQDSVGQSKPMEVTSDTPEYCLHLLDRVSDMVRLADTPVPREVTDLSTEGHRMCAHGQTRGGIMRLRSALLIMQKAGGTPYQ